MQLKADKMLWRSNALEQNEVAALRLVIFLIVNSYDVGESVELNMVGHRYNYDGLKVRWPTSLGFCRSGTMAIGCQYGGYDTLKV